MNPPKPLTGEKYHFFGIAGRGMAPLAIAAQQLGADVTGCDRQGFSETHEALRLHGIAVQDTHGAEHISTDCDFVYTSVVSRGDPEYQRAKEITRTLHRTDFLAHILGTRTAVGVTGSHGKGTVTALTGIALQHAGLDPFVLLGAYAPDIGGIVRIGSGPIVAEVDDSDTTFQTIATPVAVVNNIDFDHPHLRVSLARAMGAMSRFVANAKEAVVLGQFPRAPILEAGAQAQVWRYGRDYWASLISEHRGITRLNLRDVRGQHHEVELNLLGAKVHINAAVAHSAALALGAESSAAAEGLSKLRSIKRRLDLVGASSGISVFDDFGGKHPANVRAGLDTLRRHFHDSRIIALFEPYEPYLTTWGYRYARALSRADAVILLPPVNVSDYPAASSSKDWHDWLQPPTQSVSSHDDAVGAALSMAREGDVFVVFAQVNASQVVASRIYEAIASQGAA